MGRGLALVLPQFTHPDSVVAPGILALLLAPWSSLTCPSAYQLAPHHPPSLAILPPSVSQVSASAGGGGEGLPLSPGDRQIIWLSLPEESG